MAGFTEIITPRLDDLTMDPLYPSGPQGCVMGLRSDRGTISLQGGNTDVVGHNGSMPVSLSQSCISWSG